MRTGHINFVRESEVRTYQRKHLVVRFLSIRTGRLCLGAVCTMLLFFSSIMYRRVYHPDIRSKIALFAEASTARDLDRLYKEFDDSYREKLTLVQSRSFLLPIYAHLPPDLKLKILYIYHVEYPDGSESYDVRIDMASNNLLGKQTFITVSFIPSKDRGWTLDALPMYEAMFARLYGEKNAEYVHSVWLSILQP